MTHEEQQLVEKAARIANFVGWYEADVDLIGEPALRDDEIVMSYSGNGASDAITMGDFRELQDAIQKFVESRV